MKSTMHDITPNPAGARPIPAPSPFAPSFDLPEDRSDFTRDEYSSGV